MCVENSLPRERERERKARLSLLAIQLWHCHRSENPLRPFSPLQQRGRRRVGKLASQPAVKDFSCRIFLHAHTHTLSQVFTVFTGWKEKKKAASSEKWPFFVGISSISEEFGAKSGVVLWQCSEQELPGFENFPSSRFLKRPEKKNEEKLGRWGESVNSPIFFFIRGGKRRYQNTVSEGEVQPKVRVELVLG